MGEIFFRRTRFVVVLGYTINIVIYGSLAARWLGVRRVYTLVSGLVRRLVAATLTRIPLKRCAKTFVQNNDIVERSIRGVIVPAGKLVVVSGSGIDMHRFEFVPMTLGPSVSLLLAGILHDNGIAEYVAAARLVEALQPEARVSLVGDMNPNPAAIFRKQFGKWKKEGVIEF